MTLNFYCCLCDHMYSMRFNYRAHLKNTHRMKLMPLFVNGHRIKHPDILQDWNSPGTYCKSYESTLKIKHSYQNHCKSTHQMKLWS